MINFEQFESLDPEKQAEVFRQSPIKEKAELLIRAHEPLGLVRGLSQEEFFLIAKEMDSEERSEIIRFADLPQLCFYSDIECWSKDRLNIKGFMSWLEILTLADDMKLLQWLVFGDYELVVAGFKMILQVIKAEREYATDEILGDIPYFTLDDNYFIAVREENLESVRRAFEILFENHRGRYIGILEGILAEVDDQLEEEAYASRDRRLSERGFPSPESARMIYSPMTREEFHQYPKKFKAQDSASAFTEEETNRHAPNYIALWSKDRLFLDEVLVLLAKDNEYAFNEVREELAWLANKVIACDGIDFSSEERVKQGIERARRFVNLGLEILCDKDILAAAKILKEHWLETIFRLASGELHHLRTSAFQLVRTYWGGTKEECLGFLDPPYDLMLRGLLKAIPEFYEPDPKQEFLCRDFVSREDLARAKRGLDQLFLIHDVIQKKLPGAMIMISKSIQEQSERKITLFVLLAQTFAWYVLKKKIQFKPLTMTEVMEFLEKGWRVQGLKYLLNIEMKEAYLAEMFTPEERALSTPIWSLAFEEMNEELGGIVRNTRNLDSNLIQGLIIRITEKKQKHG
ncbi:MAG: hypothetical protein EXS63_00770 [Candidatus Omnitrophica bacterium]|nr:hypothetical protein [Candidatus Omnitrophota bacterium]